MQCLGKKTMEGWYKMKKFNNIELRNKKLIFFFMVAIFVIQVPSVFSGELYEAAKTGNFEKVKKILSENPQAV